jgi:CubicO group peptidase (beta-lactamase class C family)
MTKPSPTRFLTGFFTAALLFALAGTSTRAQEEPASGAFGGAVLQQPEPDESGALEKPKVHFGADDPAAPPAQPVAPVSSEPLGAPDGGRVKGYVDGLMNGLIAAGDLPGAAVIVIQDGKVVLKAGYGYADIHALAPVDPDQTRFRVASVSKLITATAVMQVVEEGKADINADINTYLPTFKIASNYPEPVTLANLLTHTAGFDDRYLGIASPLSAPTEPLAQYLAHATPMRVLPPNKVISYSNYGMALAGHVVENLSGQEFAAYAAEHIFAPIGMTSSTFGIPYPIPPGIAVPYIKGGSEGGFRRIDLDNVKLGPAGDLITTAADMSRFMLVHLEKGVYGDGEHLISDLSIEKMHADHFANADGLDGWAFGFATGHRNGIRWIGHDGSWRGYCAQLVLQPETKSGFFIATNADCRAATSLPLRKAMFDLLWPSSAVVTASPPPDADARARAAEGTYMTVRRARADFSLVAAGVSQIHVAAAPGGELRVTLPGIDHDLIFLPQANGTWKNPDNQWNAAWKPDGYGAGETFMIDAHAYDRVVGAGEWAAWTTALALIVAICVITMWGWASGFLSRHFFGEPQAVIGFAPRVTAFLAAGLVLSSAISIMALLSDADPAVVVHGPSPMLIVLMSVPMVIGVLAIPMVVWSVTGFGAGPRARLAQMGYMLLTLAIVAFVAFAWQWNLTPFALFGN